MKEGIDLVEFGIKEGLGGEIIIPIAPSYKVGDVAVGPDCQHEIIGVRNGEKMHELLISAFEAPLMVKKESFYLITPEKGRLFKKEYGNEIAELNQYGSDNNPNFLKVEEIVDQVNHL